MSTKYGVFMLIFVYFIINIIIISVIYRQIIVGIKNRKQFAYLNTNCLRLLHNLLTLYTIY